MITGYVNGQTLKLSAPVIAASSVRYLEAQFLFRQSDWDGLSVVRAVFSRKGGTESYSIPLTDGKVLPEDNLNLAEGVWLVHLVGSLYADGELVRRITTEDAELTVKPCSALDGEPFPDVPATEAERLWAAVRELQEGVGSGGGVDKEELKRLIDAALEEAKASGEFDGEPGKPGVSPHIGDNGNWFVGNTDTGVQAQGDDYVLTAQDKAEIAQIAAGLLPKYNGEVEDV